MKTRAGLRLSLALLALLCGACSSFDARWKTSADSRWDGRWTSDKHRAPGGGPAGGRLRAVIEPLPADKLSVHFRANWLAFASDYTMTLEPKTGGPRRSSAREFRGTHPLPKIFGGAYQYDARLAGDRLTARYTSSYDRGSFALQRLPARKDSALEHSRH